MIGADTVEEEKACRAFLSGFRLLALDQKVAETTVAIRKQRRLKLPDAIIVATAQSEQCLLVTRNTKDFKENDPSIRIPY